MTDSMKQWALKVVCPYCAAPVGSRCRTVNPIKSYYEPGTPLTMPHKDRINKGRQKQITTERSMVGRRTRPTTSVKKAAGSRANKKDAANKKPTAKDVRAVQGADENAYAMPDYPAI